MNDKEFKELQEKLVAKVIVKDEFERDNINFIAGFDMAASGKDIFCAGVILGREMKVIEIKSVTSKEEFPYTPMLLMLREGPPIFDTFAKFEKRPDIILVEGNGILHPKKAGLATYIGVSLNIPTIGVAKKLLCGEVHKGKVYFNDEERGAVLYTKKGSNPLFISPGHKISVDTAAEIVKELIKEPFKLPEPLRIAHKISVKLKKSSLGINTKTQF